MGAGTQKTRFFYPVFIGRGESLAVRNPPKKPEFLHFLPNGFFFCPKSAQKYCRVRGTQTAPGASGAGTQTAPIGRVAIIESEIHGWPSGEA